jgi:hypothetical protein
MVLYSGWVTAHNRLARIESKRIKKIIEEKATSRSLPQLPSDTLEWINVARPVVEGGERSFLAFPFWEEIYKDNCSFKMIVGGRQIFKSTYVTDLLACEATSKPNVQIGYITFSQQNLTSFSRQKLQVGTFIQNPILAQFPRNKQGNVGEISMKNGSTIYCTIDSNRYKNIEGKSLNHCILDEAQYQHMEDAQRVVQTMMATKGRLTILGIGGEAGSAYEDFWNSSDQREWVFDDPDWRKKLQFDENGLVIEKYLADVVRGRWVAEKPENTTCHGYHLPQILFATIPLTMDDARLYYKVNPMFSIEYQKKNNPASVFTTNVMGEFYRAARRPVTADMVLACMNPYRYLGMSRPAEVLEYKDLYQDKIKVSMGVDFGSGHPSHTVISILIEWRLFDGQRRLHLAYLEKRPAENQLDQAEYICNLFNAYECDIGVGDLGYGAIQVKVIQVGGTNRNTGETFSGVGSKKFIGCRTIADETKPLQVFDEKTDEHGDQTGRINIDKTTAIQELIDMLESRVSHPTRPLEQTLRKPKLMIPFKDEYYVDWLVKDFTGITRKDLKETDSFHVDPRQQPRKEFNHPKDSVMAIIYAKKALELNLGWGYFCV